MIEIRMNYLIAFPSDNHYCRFRVAIFERFGEQIEVSRERVYQDGTVARVLCPRGLGAETRAVAYNHDGTTVEAEEQTR